MYLVYGHTAIFLPYASNLKEKRKIIQSIIARIRKRFNISICEVAGQDLWQRSVLGFTAVAVSKGEADIIIDSIYSTLDLHVNEIEISSFTYDLLKENIV